jgi:hypothetical protein
MAAQHLQQRHLRLGAGRLDLREQRRLGDRQPDPQPDRHEDAGEQEGHPPAPGQERRLRQQAVQDPEHGRGEKVPGGHADLWPAGVEASPVRIAMLH